MWKQNYLYIKKQKVREFSSCEEGKTSNDMTLLIRMKILANEKMRVSAAVKNIVLTKKKGE